MIGADLFDDFTRGVLASLSTAEELSSPDGCGFVLVRIGKAAADANTEQARAPTAYQRARAKQRLDALRVLRTSIRNHRALLASTADADKDFPRMFLYCAKDVLDPATYDRIKAAAHARQDDARARRSIILANVGNALPVSGSGASAPKRRVG